MLVIFDIILSRQIVLFIKMLI